MSDIFLSYASKDRERVRLLASILEAKGWSVFWDRIIPVGMRWNDILGSELDACHCVVVIWTEASIRSPWVYEEAEEGKRKGCLFPVKLDNVLPPLGFRVFQVANLSSWQGEEDYPALQRLTDDIDTHLAQLRRKAEEARIAAENAHRAEQQRQAEEAARKAEEERRAAETARRAEQQRQAEEAARKAEQQRQAEEAARKAEQQRQAEEAARKAEQQRQAEEAARKAEQQRQAEEAARKAEEERHAAETARRAEQQRQAEEAARKAKQQRQAEETTRIATSLFGANPQNPYYDIKEKLGEGGMATVYLALHKVLEREVALKVMSPRIATTAAFRQGFIREARTVAKLDHPHIVKIYDGGANDDLFYMAMELLPGGTLKERLTTAPLVTADALNILRQLASALSYAHGKGYIHRDIKPANILFRANGDAALADFGIAKLQGVVSDMTQLGLVTGTPLYMSPEQATGGNADHRSDLYSLGIVFYEMLTGKRPFSGSTPMALAYQHLNTAIPRLPGTLAQFQPIIDRLLAKQPEERFASADELLEALGNLGKVIPPPPPPSLPPPETTPRRPARKTGIWLAGITVVTGLGLGVGYYTIDAQKQAQAQAQTTQKQAEETQKRQEQINNHLEVARIREEKRQMFDHSTWSSGCKTLLEDTDGPYDGGDSAEWHYRQVLALDTSNAVAPWELQKLEDRKKIEFLDCDAYQRPEKDANVLKDLFKE